jgi:hypothetical protein
VANDQNPEGFDLFRNDEVVFNGVRECRYIGYGLDIALNEKSRVALVTYTGPSLPSIARRYECVSSEEAATMWEADWAEPLIFAEDFDDDEPDGEAATLH